MKTLSRPFYRPLHSEYDCHLIITKGVSRCVFQAIETMECAIRNVQLRFGTSSLHQKGAFLSLRMACVQTTGVRDLNDRTWSSPQNLEWPGWHRLTTGYDEPDRFGRRHCPNLVSGFCMHHSRADNVEALLRSLTKRSVPRHSGAKRCKPVGLARGSETTSIVCACYFLFLSGEKTIVNTSAQKPEVVPRVSPNCCNRR